MNFEGSTQARSWLFDEASLQACRLRALSFDQAKVNGVKKFASGFHHRKGDDKVEEIVQSRGLTPADQDSVLRFHAHQIQSLVGPNALLPDLRNSETVLSTAITYFRRFYLSNSILDIHPRKMAVACAFFASKVEEEKVEVSITTHRIMVKADGSLVAWQIFRYVILAVLKTRKTVGCFSSRPTDLSILVKTRLADKMVC